MFVEYAEQGVLVQMVYLIYHEEEQYLDPREAASRLVQSMPATMIDWMRGNQLVEDQRQKLLARNVPDVILASHQSLVDNTAYVQIWFHEFDTDFVHFVIEPHQSFALQCSDPNNEACLTLAANKISAVLGYRTSITDADPVA
jgi:hypothetical protein